MGADDCGRGVTSRGGCAGDIDRSRRVAVRAGVGVFAGAEARTGAAVELNAVS